MKRRGRRNTLILHHPTISRRVLFFNTIFIPLLPLSLLPMASCFSLSNTLRRSTSTCIITNTKRTPSGNNSSLDKIRSLMGTTAMKSTTLSPSSLASSSISTSKLSAIMTSASTSTSTSTSSSSLSTAYHITNNIDSTETTTKQIPCPRAENDNDEYSLCSLQKRAEYIINNNNQQEQDGNHDRGGSTTCKLVIGIAGGGGHSISTLAATSGASKLLLEGTVSYDRISFQRYVGNMALPTNDKKLFSFSSLQAAGLLSKSSLLLGMQLQSQQQNDDDNNNNNNNRLYSIRSTIGVGSASTLKTTTKGGMSKSGRPSHGNIVITCANGKQYCLRMVLNCPTQNRFHQDVFVSHMIYQSIEEMLINNNNNNNNNKQQQQQQQEHQNGKKSSLSSSVKEEDNDDESILDPEEYNGVTIQYWRTNASSDMIDDNDDDSDNSMTISMNDPVQSAAHRILSGEEKAVLLLPKAKTQTTTTTTTTASDTTSSSNNQKSTVACDFLEPLLYPVLPNNCLLLPGSFNPPHIGHISLAKAAISKLSSLSAEDNDDSSGSDDNSDQQQQKGELRPLVFEISIVNADKPAMEPEEVARRVSQFRDILYDTTEHDDDIPQWGVLLTSAPLFADKVRDLKPYAPPSLQPDPNFPVNDSGDINYQKNNRWSFVIGTDTMVRILNPKYYDNSYDKMLEAQRSMGADFVVGGRLEQTDDKKEKQFVTGKESLEGLPADIQDVFVILEESDFRMDISSTEIRAQQHQKEKQQ